jgi:hypothetical protein
MHAVKRLHECLRYAQCARRREVLLRSVAALIAGRRLVLMDFAHTWSGQERVAVPLKRIDRLLRARLHATFFVARHMAAIARSK